MGNTEEAFAFIQSPSAIIVDIRFFYLREQQKPFSIQRTREQQQQITFTVLFFFFTNMIVFVEIALRFALHLLVVPYLIVYCLQERSFMILF